MFCNPLVKEIQWFKERQAVAKPCSALFPFSNPDGSVLKSFKPVNLLDVREKDKITGGQKRKPERRDLNRYSL